MIRHLILLPLILFAACAGGSTAPTAKAAAPQSQAEEAAIATAIQQIESKKSDYLISNADLINVSVLGEEEMTRLVRVSQNGTITYPLIGSVTVGGLSTSQAEAAISAKLNTQQLRYGKPGLQAHIQYLSGMTGRVDQKVGRDALARYAELKRELDAIKAELNKLFPPKL